MCDREADLYEYLDHKLRQGQRFVVRAKVDRRVLESESSLFETLKTESAPLCCYRVQVAQRGGRPARTAKLSLRGMTLAVMPPAGKGAKCAPLRINALLAEEIDAPLKAEPLCWVLLTTEPVARAEDALTVVRHYECRWRIEEYTRHGKAVWV